MSATNLLFGNLQIVVPDEMVHECDNCGQKCFISSVAQEQVLSGDNLEILRQAYEEIRKKYPGHHENSDIMVALMGLGLPTSVAGSGYGGSYCLACVEERCNRT